MTKNVTNINALIILNGPPESGKDTLADYIIKFDKTCSKTKLAHPLKEGCKGLYGLTTEQMKYFESNGTIKNSPHELFFGKSWREVNIHLSEKYMKPTYGKDIFGKILANRIKTQGKPGETILVSDGGFDEEIVPLIEAFGKDKIVIIKLYRKDKTFKEDSRNYINTDKLGIVCYELHNKKLDSFLKDGWDLVQILKTGKRPTVKSNVKT